MNEKMNKKTNIWKNELNNLWINDFVNEWKNKKKYCPLDTLCNPLKWSWHSACDAGSTWLQDSFVKWERAIWHTLARRSTLNSKTHQRGREYARDEKSDDSREIRWTVYTSTRKLTRSVTGFSLFQSQMMVPAENQREKRRDARKHVTV